MENKTALDNQVDPAEDRRIADRHKDIPGWGMDADPRNEPTYPMKHYTGADFERLNYQRPPQQPQTVEILHSIERPSVTSVFGTVSPPAGLSGSLRRYAFRYSESTYMHWVPLVMADRIGVVEGILDDLRRGRFPNIFAEKGWGAEWKYNKPGLIKKVVTLVAVVTVVSLLIGRKKR